RSWRSASVRRRPPIWRRSWLCEKPKRRPPRRRSRRKKAAEQRGTGRRSRATRSRRASFSAWTGRAEYPMNMGTRSPWRGSGPALRAPWSRRIPSPPVPRMRGRVCPTKFLLMTAYRGPTLKGFLALFWRVCPHPFWFCISIFPF
ncbi:unnamed protein product, partial [Musa textilis]